MKWKKDHVKEDMTHDRDSGDARSKDIHSPTLQRQKDLEKSKTHYLIKPVTATKTKNPIKEGKKEPKSAALRLYMALQKAKKEREREERLGHELLHGKKPEPKKEGNQMTALTPEDHQPTMQDRVNNARVGDTIGRTKVVRDFMFEDIYADNKAATQTVDSPGEGISEKKKQMSKSARMIKALYKKHRMVKEDLYDHEKEDKSVATYGKKPKFDKAEKDEGGEKKPSAAATLTGGTTLTGEKRDDVEIDPMMRARPGQPDPTKKDDKKDGKKEDKKKDK
jgi:hypothetical protein